MASHGTGFLSSHKKLCNYKYRSCVCVMIVNNRMFNNYVTYVSNYESVPLLTMLLVHAQFYVRHRRNPHVTSCVGKHTE